METNTNKNFFQFVTTLISGKNLFDRPVTKERQKRKIFVHSLQQATRRIKKTQLQNCRQSSHIDVRFTLPESLWAAIHTENF